MDEETDNTLPRTVQGYTVNATLATGGVLTSLDPRFPPTESYDRTRIFTHLDYEAATIALVGTLLFLLDTRHTEKDATSALFDLRMQYRLGAPAAREAV